LINSSRYLSLEIRGVFFSEISSLIIFSYISESPWLYSLAIYKIKLVDYFGRETLSSEIEIKKNDVPSLWTALSDYALSEDESLYLGMNVRDIAYSGGDWEIRYTGGTVLYQGTWSSDVVFPDQTIYANDLLFSGFNYLEFWCEDALGESSIDEFSVYLNKILQITSEPTGFTYSETESGTYELTWEWFDDIYDFIDASLSIWRKRKVNQYIRTYFGRIGMK